VVAPRWLNAEAPTNSKPPGVVEQALFGQRREERVCDGIVEARADRSHRLRDASVVAGLTEGQTDELTGFNRSLQHRLVD
jgi:hypothetical protein